MAVELRQAETTEILKEPGGEIFQTVQFLHDLSHHPYHHVFFLATSKSFYHISPETEFLSRKLKPCMVCYYGILCSIIQRANIDLCTLLYKHKSEAILLKLHLIPMTCIRNTSSDKPKPVTHCCQRQRNCLERQHEIRVLAETAFCLQLCFISST